MVAARGRLPDLSALVPGLRTATASATCEGIRQPPRLPRVARRRRRSGSRRSIRSPMADFGYDVADYCDVDPLFGTLDDFDGLLAEAHARGLQRHPRLRPEPHLRPAPVVRRVARVARQPEARLVHLARPGARRRRRRTTGSATSAARAWTLDETTGQYYYHAFLAEQPDLNWRNPEVRDAMYDVLRFWLERGVDGFRIDVDLAPDQGRAAARQPAEPRLRAERQSPYRAVAAGVYIDRPAGGPRRRRRDARRCSTSTTSGC